MTLLLLLQSLFFLVFLLHYLITKLTFKYPRNAHLHTQLSAATYGTFLPYSALSPSHKTRPCPTLSSTKHGVAPHYVNSLYTAPPVARYTCYTCVFKQTKKKKRGWEMERRKRKSAAHITSHTHTHIHIHTYMNTASDRNEFKF
jgi:hypothetical protein